MRLIRRAAWAAALLVLFAATTTAFPPPIVRPTTPTIPPPTFRPPPTFPGGSMGGRVPGPSGIRLPGSIPTRTPSHVVGEVRGLITAKPGIALPRLGSVEAQMLLPHTTRITLGKEAVFRLGVQVETGGNAVKNLAEVRVARQFGGNLPAEVRTGLDRLAQVAERRVLSEGLQEVRYHADRGHWGEAAQKAHGWRTELGSHPSGMRPVESLEFTARKTEVLDALKQAEAVGRKLDTLETFQAVLKDMNVHDASRSTSKLAGVDRGALPKSVEAHADALIGLAELKQAIGQKWPSAPDAARLRDAVVRLERGLAEVGQGEAQVGKMIQQELAVRAALEGHTEAYFKLVPEGGPKEFAGQMLRDLKATALGQGKVETPVFKSALAGEGGAAEAAPRAPPGVEPLLPEGAKSSWRPPVQEPAKADLPPMQKAADAAGVIKRQAEAHIPKERSALSGQADAARAHMGQVHARVIQPELAERRRWAEVEAELDRRLRADERVRIRGWLDDGRTTAQMIAGLEAQPGADDEEGEFVAAVQRRLSRPLNVGEKDQAKRLRRQGRTAAEVADILRS